ncbi:MAG TPA: ATP synthase F1 subunit gamma [Erysipelothrix sp.]|nr:ATP synthase F1 subunit gamma [Erysipelothrix sp.]
MANNIHQLRGRLKSIRSTQKITKAMRLVAISKLQQIKGRFVKNKPYSETLAQVIRHVLAHGDGSVHPMMDTSLVDDKPLMIVFTSDLGLAGGYNQSIFRELLEQGNKKDLIWIGTKGFKRFNDLEYKISNELILSDKVDYQQILELGNNIITRFRDKEITSIHILYTEYVNATTYYVKQERILPVQLPENYESGYKEIIFEPSASVLLDQLIPRYVISELYRTFMSAKTSEYSSRRVAMENATDNAQELIDDLQLEYNKVRQAAITQEITEIVSGTVGG